MFLRLICMLKVDQWPPPEGWTEVVIPWSQMLRPWPLLIDSNDTLPNTILSWVEKTPGGRYHLHGWRSSEGFAFRFEQPQDASLFALRWS